MVAMTLDALRLQAFDIVLEVGTGSGYQAALLAELVQRVYSIERHSSLAFSAKTIVQRLGCSNVEIAVGDGSQGFSAHAPFDAIAVAAATAEIPSALLRQLREGGRMVIPVGSPNEQELQLVRKRDGVGIVTALATCRFVPLISSAHSPSER
jgi:protein-L-isoaspartate(D-aspartate) O-methyltransferase